MLRKRCLPAVLASALAVALMVSVPSSAVGHPREAVRASATTTVVLSGWASSPQETTSLANVLAAFEATHPTITVDYQPVEGNYQAAMESRFAAGNPPDVFYVDSSVAPDWIAKGFLLPLGGFVTSSGFDTTHFFPVLRRAFEGPGGQPYGFPKDWSPLAMFTNDTLLAQAGVVPPTTWAELRTAAESLRAATGVTPICLSSDWARLLAFVEENGGSFLNDARTAATIDSPAAREAVEFYVGLVNDGLAALPGTLGSDWCGQAFADGRAAITFEGNWLVPVLAAAPTPIGYTIHPLLSKVRRGNLAFTVAYSIAAASPHKQAAWELLSYLTGREGMGIWTSGGVALPSRDDVAPAPGSEVFQNEAPVSTVWQFPPGFSNVLTLANQQLTAVLAGHQTIDTMLTAIEAAANTALHAVLPKVTSFAPPSGVAGTTVTISGSGFGSSSAVSFGGVSGQVVSATATKVVAKVPAGAPVGAITVTTPAGSATSTGVFKPAPKLTNADPAPARAGETLTLTGSNLLDATTLKLGPVPVTIASVDSATQITTSPLPDTVLTGSFVVVTPGGTSAGLTLGVRPSISGLSTTNGLAGTVVTVTGKTLTGTKSVAFGGAKASFKVLSAAQLRATVPTTALTGPVTVTNAGGTTASPNTFTVLPRLTSFTPASGVAGTLVSISGSGLGGATDVSFGGVSAQVVSVTATKVVAKVPITAPVAAITVTTPADTATSSGVFKPIPKLASASPSPAQAGDTLTLTGSNLLAATLLKLGPVPLTIASVDSATQITTSPLPDSALTGSLVVVTPGGASAGLAVGVRPTVSGLSTTTGLTGTVVTITGKTLTGTKSVAFGGAKASFKVLSAAQLRATVPTTAITGPITVTNAGGTTPSPDTFTVLPRVTSFTPTAASAGTTITINGTGLGGATAVKFNSTNAVGFTVASTLKITAILAQGTTSGPVSVTTPAGTAVSAGTLTVRQSGTAQVLVAPGQPVQIAFADDLTGQASSLAASLANAVHMAVDAHPTVRGFPIQINLVDAPCGSPAADTAAARGIAANTQNVGVLGQLCSFGFDKALPIYQSAGIVTISGSATADALPAFGPTVFNRTAVKDGDGFDSWYATVSQSPGDLAWRQAYSLRFGTAPTVLADLYYDAASLLVQNLESVSTLDDADDLVVNRAALVQAVRNTTDYPGVSCTITLDPITGNRLNNPAGC